jgi:hypothetical protein
MVTCPVCRGAKESTGIGCGAGGCRPVTLRCRFCKVRVWWTRPVRHGGARVKEGAGNGCGGVSRSASGRPSWVSPRKRSMTSSTDGSITSAHDARGGEQPIRSYVSGVSE